MTTNEELDVRGLGCASVLIELARLRRERPASWPVEVHTDDAGAATELPAWCRLTGCTFVGAVGSPGTAKRYRLVLNPPAPPAPTPSAAPTPTEGDKP